MAGVKGRSGMHGRQGRTTTSVRPLADQIGKLFEALSQKYPGLILQAEYLEIERCPGCGCISWQPYEITANNSEFEVVGREQVAGNPAQHSKNCASYNGEGT